jgi:hypothetical protein
MSDSVSISVDHRAIAPLQLPCPVKCGAKSSIRRLKNWTLRSINLGGFCGALRDDSVKFPESFGMVPGRGNDDQRDKGIKSIRELGMCRSSVCVGRGIGRRI